VNIYPYPTAQLAPHIQRFVEQFLQLESTVRAGEATDIEQFVYVTANLAVRHARDEQELLVMLQQWHDQMAVAAAELRFPQVYRDTFAYAGQRYQCLMDTLFPCRPGAGEEAIHQETQR
jgi:hypothetical protein